MSNGWIKLYRQLLDDEMYFAESKFDKGHAWIDLLLMAAHEPRTFLKRGIEVQLAAGDVAISLDDLAKRWKWSKHTVNAYLLRLKLHHKISISNSKLINIIHIDNWAKYQDDCTTNCTTNCTTIHKNIKKDKKENISLSQAASAYTHAYEGEDQDEKEKKLREQLLHGSDAWLETMAAKIHISTDAAKEKRERFVNETTIKDERHRDLRDIRSHFFNWLKIEIKSETKQTTINNQGNGTNNRTNNADAAEAARQKRMQEATELMQRYAAESGIDFDVRNIR